MDKQKVLKELNHALTTEYQAVIQYLTHATIAKGIDSDAVISLLKHIAEEEMKHAEILRERIFWLGGTPTMDVDERTLVKDIKQMLKVNAKAEEDAIKMYKGILKMLNHIEDIEIYEAIEEILEDEIEHWEEFTRLQD
ncbi:MAG: ferritin-like domain-containing protein [Candidatus Aenigmarchaeota archaeon]|nr:ferritin-like domain-containing protein [Candidatus Aenigmarchaeota archaeon]